MALLDQATYSLSSVLLAVMVARESSVEAVGAWAMSYAFYTFVLAVLRSAINTTALVKPPSVPGERDTDDRALDNSAFSAEVTVSLALCATMIGASVVITEPAVARYFLVFGVGAPILLAQDGVRYWMIRHKRIGLATVIDVIWLVFQVIVGWALFALFDVPELITVAWIVGALISSFVGLLYFRPKVRIGLGIGFFRENSAISGRLLAESLLNSSVANGLPAMVGLILGLAAAGSFRGAMTLLGVVGIVISGLTPLMTVEMVDRLRKGNSPAMFVWVWSLGLAVVGAALTICIAVLPDSLGVEILGDTWHGTKGIIVLMAIQVMFRGPITGLPIVLRAMHLFSVSLRFQLAKSVATLVIIIVGALCWGLQGVAVGWLLTAIVVSIYALFVLQGVVRRFYAQERGAST